MGVPLFNGTRDLSVDCHNIHPLLSLGSTIRNVGVSTQNTRLEIQKSGKEAAFCIPTQPTMSVRSNDLHRLRDWWRMYKYNIAYRFGIKGSIFLVLSKKTTSQYANCFVNNGIQSTAIDISNVCPETYSFLAGGQMSEVSSNFGFVFGTYDSTLSPWAIFITREKVKISGPLSSISRAFQRRFRPDLVKHHWTLSTDEFNFVHVQLLGEGGYGEVHEVPSYHNSC